MLTRENIIKEILKKVPDMKVLYIDKVSESKWPHEKIITDLTPEEFKQFNLRKQLPNEILLDLEEKWQLDGVLKKLEDKKWSYVVWETGSRGYHISVKFSNLEEQPLELRNRIRKYIINYFQTDEKMARENQWMAMELTPHFKTGNRKLLVNFMNYEAPTIIDKDIIDYCKKDIELVKRKQIENKEIIKDYNKNDPYLKYVLTHTIEAGDRNNVLFKNLAIGLVRAGLTREQIIPYAENIVRNCPGKMVGEFMGWVDKALSGKMTDYNKEELVQWSVNYGKPILYETYKDEDLLDLMTIKQLWDELWEHTIISQPVWRELCYYNMLGTIVDERDPNIDLRTHVIFASDSGSGKDEGVNLVRNILERLGYKTKSPSTVTDKTLIGNINQSKIDFNVKYQLSPDEPVKGKYVYKEPIEKGWLEDTNWLAFSESEFILKPGAYNKNIQIILRQAMDKARRVDKGVSNYEIKIRTNTTFMMTTFPMNNVINSVLHNGLFQRTLFYNKNLKESEHKAIRLFTSKRNFGINKDDFNREKYISKLLEKLRIMKQWYTENRTKIEYEEGSDKVVNALWDKLEKEYSSFFPSDKNILNTIVRRANENLRKMTTLNTIARQKTFVTKNVIRECFEISKASFDSIKELLVKQNVTVKRTYSIMQKIASESISKSMMYEYMKDNFGIKSSGKAIKIIKDLIEREYVTVFKIGRTEMLSLTGKGRDYLLNEE